LVPATSAWVAVPSVLASVQRLALCLALDGVTQPLPLRRPLDVAVRASVAPVAPPGSGTR
jgi:hypothetical protein